MPRNFVRAIFKTFLLLQFNVCFAATTVYVNVNNPTPGAGTSWATAYNDLNAAFAAAPYGADIWVAQGTYYPTTGTDRTIAFNVLPTYVHVYGGFIGNETLVTQRDFRNHPTILSGDIGIRGDASDNSYSVVRFNAGANGSSTFDGFIIRDGNANDGYPGSTTPSLYNQGGGIELYSAQVNFYTYAYAVVLNCTFINNFAVYGGAYASYSTTGTIAFAVAFNCVFKDNTAAVAGGAYATVSVNADVVSTDLLNSVFINNKTINGGGSAISTYVDTNPNAVTTNVKNCVFYNNPLPLINSVLLNGAAGSNIWCDYSIFWNPTAYPDNSFIVAGGIHYSDCDMYMATASGGNTNVDPLFVDAAADNFHVSPCSPAIDYGGYAYYGSPWNTDFDGNPRLQGGKEDLGIYEATKTTLAAPTVSTPTVNYCEGATVTNDLATLVVSPTGTLNWYDASNNALTGAPTPSTTVAASSIYYVSQSVGTGCESPKTRVTVVVGAAPSTPSDPGLSYCLNATPADLNLSITKDAPANTLIWYSAATAGTVLPATPVISTATAGSQYFYVSQKDGCESGIATVEVNVTKTDAPVTTDPAPAYCQGATATALDITGTSLLWYTAATGGVGVTQSTAPTPSTSATGTQNYYISQTLNGCESDRTVIAVTVNTPPAAPTVTTPLTYCQLDTPDDLNDIVTEDPGAALTWYTALTGGTALTAVPVISTATAGPQNYYVSQTLGCESTRSAIAVIVNNKPAAPTTTNTALTYCAGVPAATLDATGANLQWYTGATLLPAAPTPSTATTGTVNYGVSQTVSGCESEQAVISVTVETQLPAPVATDVTYCLNDPAIALTATGNGLLWYTTDAGGTGSTDAPQPLTTSSGNTTYYVSQSNNGVCESDRTAITVTVNDLPQVNINTAGKPACRGTYVTLQASGAASYQWSPATGLSNVAVSNPLALMDQDISYTVTGTDINGCKATAQVDLQVNNNCGDYLLPTAFTPNGDGLNDLFHVVTYNIPKTFSMQVFNRYGGIVFASNDISAGWDGTLKGNPAPDGTYVYVILINTSDGKVINKKGTVLLIR
ncbi:T9SS type B sorting domain-containing protein [Chitinophaga oryziterrae]|uniref:T9SS type B sorting domain-containing protein n=1 Tax=Chitinophaga oryziterrae TaxID=1031224 RepID=A0A6N8JAK7_9BACT|nr:gliding motility-associated C-terminal domain-containing protein [Chitinophaga oryziterrae]MVT41518.1 T9SS type B sorting domain-containing protein [Chitinophaga oryziterrae]